MSINIPARSFRVPLLDAGEADRKARRDRTIDDMTMSLIEMFGERASLVADGQPGLRDVGGDSGIRWRDISRALRAAGLR